MKEKGRGGRKGKRKEGSNENVPLSEILNTPLVVLHRYEH